MSRYYNNVRNFAKAGNIGRFPIINVIEASVLALVEIWLVFQLPLEFKYNLLIACVLLFPTLLISLNGIMGCTLIELIIKLVRFLMSKRKYSDPSPAEAGAREREILLVKKKQLRLIQIEENKKRKEEEKQKKAEAKKLKAESEKEESKNTGEEAGHADGEFF